MANDVAIEPLHLDGLKLVRPRVHHDDRGFFLETFRTERYTSLGVDFVQDNHSRSGRGTLRGMHFQRTPGQAKLVRCARGMIFDVVVDIRPASPTFMSWHAELLDDRHHHQLFVPVGFAHGFLVVSEVADVIYRVSTPYNPATEDGFHYADPDVGITWPKFSGLPDMNLSVSNRDRDARPFHEVIAR